MSDQQEKIKTEKREHPVLRGLGCIISAVVMVWIGWMAHSVMPTEEQDDLSDTAASAAEQGTVPQVEVIPVTEATLNPPTEYFGRVEPMQDVDLRAQIDGYVIKVHFTEGAMVKQGDLLYTIDPERYEAQVAVRKAEIGQEEAAFDSADRYLKRLEQSDSRAIIQRDLDTARSEVDKCRAAIKQAEANLVLAEFDLKHTEIRAPISGRIGRSTVFTGDYVAPSLGSLARIIQIDPIRVAFPVTDKDYLRMRSHSGGYELKNRIRIRLRMPTGEVPALFGVHDFDDNAMSPDTATLLVRARFDNSNDLLIPGGYVTVLADLTEPSTLPVVSQESLMLGEAGSFVYVVDENNIARARPVKRGVSSQGMVAVVEGLELGERVVRRGVLRVAPDQPVQVISGKESETP